MKPRKKYADEVVKIISAIDIAIEAFEKFDVKDKDVFIRVYKDYKEKRLNAEAQYRNMASLNYTIADILTWFQEGTGDDVEYFWKQVEKQNLGYIREDKLAKILNRGKILGRIEYEYVTDVIVAAEQENRITENQAVQLKIMVGDFEIRRR